MSYISKETAIEAIKESHDCGEYLQETLARIEELPAADVVDVTPCKNCKYHLEAIRYKDVGEEPYIRHTCKILRGYSFSPEFYCGIAERAEGEENRTYGVR